MTVLKYWVPVLCLIAFACFVVNLLAQQVMRYMANAQAQMAEDAASALVRGQHPEELTRGDTIDIGRSVAPFLIVFNEQGVPVTSNAVLDGVVPKPPPGVFCSCGGAENRVTWQPRRGVRIASVIVHHGGAQSGFVLAGRSLRESEWRTGRIGMLLFPLWAVAALGSLIVIAAITRHRGL